MCLDAACTAEVCSRPTILAAYHFILFDVATRAFLSGWGLQCIECTMQLRFAAAPSHLADELYALHMRALQILSSLLKNTLTFVLVDICLIGLISKTFTDI